MAKFELYQELRLTEDIESSDGIMLYALEGDEVVVLKVEPEALLDGIYVSQSYIVCTKLNCILIRVEEHQLSEGTP